MISYPEQPSLAQLQVYIKQKCQERGFDKASDLETFLLFMEEVGEMAKAIRNRRKLFLEHKSNHDNLAEEMADVLSYLLDLASRFDIDLEQALHSKEIQNDKRTWND